MPSSLPYDEIWLVDFEFQSPSGERPTPICLVALEIKSGRLIRIGEDDLRAMSAPPYCIGKNSLVIAYYASAEIGCHLALGWQIPVNILDLFTEFRNANNGLHVQSGYSLLGALVSHGIQGIESIEKESMCALANRGGPWSDDEKHNLLNYCESDVRALEQLLPKMMSRIDLKRALLRGRYMATVATIENCGIPIDSTALATLSANWELIQDELIARIDAPYGVYEGRTFKKNRFAAFLAERNIAWPHLASGQLDLRDDTFREMAKAHHEISPLRELRHALASMRLSKLAVGADSRNRCLLSPFQAKTSRNQPSNTQFIFGPSVWLRSLIKPSAGYGLAYIDYSQQEFGIAAALSGDVLMMEAYRSGDPYMAFAIQAGAAPIGATKHSHSAVRDQFKACVLAVQYGMGAESLSFRIGQPAIRAQELLDLHRRTYETYWSWSDAALNHALLAGKIWTVFGWTLHIDQNPNDRSIRNFLMQANGAEMLRVACILATDAGIRVCAPVHDAILIEAPLDELDATIAKTQELMAQASEIVLPGFRLRSDAEVVRYPDRYRDKRGAMMWGTVCDILDAVEPGHGVSR